MKTSLPLSLLIFILLFSQLDAAPPGKPEIENFSELFKGEKPQKTEEAQGEREREKTSSLNTPDIDVESSRGSQCQAVDPYWLSVPSDEEAESTSDLLEMRDEEITKALRALKLWQEEILNSSSSIENHAIQLEILGDIQQELANSIDQVKSYKKSSLQNLTDPEERAKQLSVAVLSKKYSSILIDSINEAWEKRASCPPSAFLFLENRKRKITLTLKEKEEIRQTAINSSEIYEKKLAPVQVSVAILKKLRGEALLFSQSNFMNNDISRLTDDELRKFDFNEFDFENPNEPLNKLLIDSSEIPFYGHEITIPSSPSSSSKRASLSSPLASERLPSELGKRKIDITIPPPGKEAWIKYYNNCSSSSKEGEKQVRKKPKMLLTNRQAIQEFARLLREKNQETARGADKEGKLRITKELIESIAENVIADNRTQFDRSSLRKASRPIFDSETIQMLRNFGLEKEVALKEAYPLVTAILDKLLPKEEKQSSAEAIVDFQEAKKEGLEDEDAIYRAVENAIRKVYSDKAERNELSVAYQAFMACNPTVSSREAFRLVQPIVTKIMNKFRPKKVDEPSPEVIADFQKAKNRGLNDQEASLEAALEAARRAASSLQIKMEKEPLRTYLTSIAYHAIKNCIPTLKTAEITKQAKIITKKIMDEFHPKKVDPPAPEVISDFEEAKSRGLNDQEASLEAALEAARRAASSLQIKMEKEPLRTYLTSIAYHAIKNCIPTLKAVEITKQAQPLATKVVNEVFDNDSKK